MTCERMIWSHGEDRRCSQVVGLTRWHDTSGQEHAACRNHLAVMQHLWPLGDPPMPDWLHDEPESADPMTMAKWSAWIAQNADSWTLT